jgi:hypothetical protein
VAQDLLPLGQPGHDLGQAERTDPGGGQFQRQRQPIEQAAQLRRCPKVGSVQPEAGQHRFRPLGEQRQRTAALPRHPRVRDIQPAQPEHALTAGTDKFP